MGNTSVIENFYKTHNIKSLNQLDELRERIKESFDSEKAVTIIILENEKETMDRFLMLLRTALSDMEEYHQKSYKEFEKKHIENYINKRYGYIKKMYINKFFKELGI